MATITAVNEKAIHTLNIGGEEYPIYGRGFKTSTLGSSANNFYPLLLSNKSTVSGENLTANDYSEAAIADTVGHLSWLPSSSTLYVQNLRIGGIPGGSNNGGTLSLSGNVKARPENGTGLSLGESNQVLASGGADNNVHWRTIDLVDGKDTIGLVKNGSAVNPDGDTWKPVAFKDGVPYYQEVKVDISSVPGLEDVLNDLRNSIFTQGDGIEISGGADGSAKTISVAKATGDALGGIKIGSTMPCPVELDESGKAYVSGCKTLLQNTVTKTDTVSDGKVVTGVTITQNTNGDITGVTVDESDLPAYEDKSVTSVAYHYQDLTADPNKILTASSTGEEVDITQKPTPVITGIKRDAAGHIVDIVTTDLYSSGIEIPDGPDLSDYKTKQDVVEKTDTAADGKVVTGVTINQNTNGEITGVTVAETDLDDTYLKKTGGTVNGTINVIADGITITSNSTIESAGFRATGSVVIDGTEITAEGPNTFYIGDRVGDNHVIFGVDGNGVTTTEVRAANIYGVDVYVNDFLQTPKLQSDASLIQSVPEGESFKFEEGDTTPLEINGESANFDVVVRSSMGFFDTSDERKKNFIRPIDVDLEKLSTLKKHYFTWKDGDGEMQIGTSAQEVKELYPELVNETEDGTLTVAYNKLSVVALAAIDRLHNENTELKKKVSTLEERLERLESLLEEKLNNL